MPEKPSTLYSCEMLNYAHLYFGVICENCECWREDPETEGVGDCHNQQIRTERVDYCPGFIERIKS